VIRVAALGEILRRFRFHGVPGAPVASGVPVDRAAVLGSEVAAVFAALQDDQRGAEALLAKADVEAERIRAAGAEQARKVAEASRKAAATARETVAARIRNETSKDSAAILAAARSEADRIERVAAERFPPLVTEIVRSVLAIGSSR
jgi:flagellar biosynthesis/type III secretory pathway protein FliH